MKSALFFQKTARSNIFTQLKHFLRRARHFGLRYKCNLCGSSLKKFRPLPAIYQKTADKFGSPYSFADFETINLQNYACPVCGATDRDRLYALFLRHRLGTNQTHKLLDIAPSAALSSWMRRKFDLEYRSADLMAPDVDDQIDITNMHIYEDGQFDFFVCSHVLEHVHDDIQALKELHRILKKEGCGIAMVPIHLGIQRTLYNPQHTSEAERWHHYSQGDHVRAYSRSDFVAALQGVGFRVLQFGIMEFGADLFKKHAIGERSVLYVVEKP